MAKKKAVVTEIEGQTTEEMMQANTKRIQEKYGGGDVSGRQYVNRPVMTIPFSPALDLVTGGIKEGTMVGLLGNEKTGKTVTALSLAATCQRPEYGSRPVYYGRVEARLSEAHLQDIEGLDVDNRFRILGSTKNKIWSAQDHLECYYEILKSTPGCVLIIDSISALVDENVIVKGLGTETRGGTAKLFSQWLDLVKDVVDVNGCIVIGISHLISNTSGMGDSLIERAARRWKYYCSYRLKTTWAEKLLVGAKKNAEGKDEGGKAVGLKVHWQCLASPKGGGSAFGKTTSLIRFGIGIDKVAELAQIAIDINLIKKTGGWYYLDFMPGGPKANGVEQLYKLLRGNPDIVETMNAKVRELFSDDVEENEEVET